MKPTRNLFVRALSVSLAACLTANAITWDGGAQSNNWSGTGNGSNSGDNNWDTNTAPAPNNPLVFAGTTRLAPSNNTTADTSYAGITFNNTAGAFVLGGNRITLGGDITNSDTGLQTINMNLLLSGTRTFNAASGNLAVGGVIDDGASSFGLTKTGNNVLTLSVSNTYNGATTIKAGTLKLDGLGSIASSNIVVGDAGSVGAILDATTRTGNFVVANGQTVSGIGTIQGSTTIQLNGTIAPGNSDAGILNNLGDIALQAGSNLAIELGGTAPGIGGYDQLNVTGSATLGGLLAVSTIGGFTPTFGSLFFVLANDSNDAISGVFSNAPTNGSTYTLGGQQFQISYFGNHTGGGAGTFTGGNDVALMAIPEPSAPLIAGIGALLLLRRRRSA